MTNKVRVLAFVDYYLPGFKGGGPLVSVSRLAESVRDAAELSVFTRDRDLGDSEPYADVRSGSWSIRGGSSIYYAGPRDLTPWNVLKVVKGARPETIYLNSLFSKMTLLVLTLRRLGLVGKTGIVLAPRGELSTGALALKARKKTAFLKLANFLGLYRGVLWIATAEKEKSEIKAVFPGAACVVSAAIPARPSAQSRPSKSPGSCRFVFLSRVSPKKNLEFALKTFSSLKGDVSLRVYGAAESEEYRGHLLRLCSQLPDHVSVEFLGPVHPTEVPAKLAQNHFFLLPTLGENFGHVIAEAMSVAVPCVLSDTTPWSDIEPARAGWAVSLQDEGLWVRRLQECIDMDGATYRELTQRVEAYYSDWLATNRCEDADEIFRLAAAAA